MKQFETDLKIIQSECSSKDFLLDSVLSIPLPRLRFLKSMGLIEIKPFADNHLRIRSPSTKFLCSKYLQDSFVFLSYVLLMTDFYILLCALCIDQCCLDLSMPQHLLHLFDWHPSV